MTGPAKYLRSIAFTVMALLGLFGGLMAAGSAFEDPGGWAAAGLTASWLVPLVALSVFAWRKPAAAGPVFVGATGLVVLMTIADFAFGLIPSDEWGPVTGIAVFALGVTLAFLGLHRAVLAGQLMVVAGLGQLVVILMGAGGGLAGPAPVLMVPLLVAGLLFVLAGSLSHQPLRTWSVHAG